LICFGSRVDLYLPEDTQLTVKVGEKVKAGYSVIGRLPSGKGSAPDPEKEV